MLLPTGPDSRRLTSLRFCCAANVVTESAAREPDVYRDCSNRLLERARRMVHTLVTVLGVPQTKLGWPREPSPHRHR